MKAALSILMNSCKFVCRWSCETRDHYCVKRGDVYKELNNDGRKSECRTFMQKFESVL